MTENQQIRAVAFTNAMDLSILALAFKNVMTDLALHILENARYDDTHPYSEIYFSGLRITPVRNPSYTLVDFANGHFENMRISDLEDCMSRILDLYLRGRTMMHESYGIPWDIMGSISSGILTGMMRIYAAKKKGTYVDALPKQLNFSVNLTKTDEQFNWTIGYNTNGESASLTFPAIPE